MLAERIAAAVCGWLATYLIHSMLLLLLAWAVARHLSSRLDALAELVWRSALGLPLITAITQHALTDDNLARAPGIASLTYAPTPLAASAVPGALWIAVVAAWMAGAAIGLARLYLCHRGLRRQIRDRSVLPRERLVEIGDLVPDSVRVSVVSELSVPFARAREICLPGWLVERLPAAEFRAVVAHELAHVRRHDVFWRSAASAVARGFFFQPLNWLAVARLREISECICDDDAVSATRSCIPLASALETVARRMGARRELTLAPAIGAPGSLIVKRVERILDAQSGGQRGRAPIGLARGGAVVALLAGAAMAFAPSVRVPALAFQRYTIDADDPAGHFTITLQKGRVVGATIAGQPLRTHQVRQRGLLLELVDDTEKVLSLRLTPEGGVTWKPRSPATGI